MLLTSFIPNQPASKIKKYSLKDGLPLGVVNSITQDHKGQMWFATDAGLIRFDGYAFKVFHYDPEQEYSLTGTFIQKVFRDSEGVIWVSSRHGLNRFDARTERFIHYQHNPADKGSIVGNDISAVIESGGGNLWVASYNAGFSYFNRAQNRFVTYNKQKLPALSSNKIVSLHQDSQGLLWVGTQDAGVHVFRVRKGRVLEKVSRLAPPGSLPSPNIKCIYEDHLHNLWIGTARGLVLYQRSTGRYFVFNARDYGLSSNIVLSVQQDSQEMLWIGLQDGGAYQLDLRQFNRQALQDFTFAAVHDKDGSRLTRRSVQALYEDKDHNMWLGTYGDGLYMISHVKENFIKLRHPKAAGTRESDIRYYGICTDSEGYLWLGTDGDGIYKCKQNGEVVRHFTARQGPAGLTDNAILCAVEDGDRNLWFGSYAHGLFLYRKETGTFVNFRHDPADGNTLGGNDVRVIFEDSRCNLWVGTNGGGLSLFNKATSTFTSFNTANSRITSNDIRAIAEDKDGQLWIGTYGGGLYRFSPASRTFTPYPYSPRDKDYLLSGVILALQVDARRHLWIGTDENGLIRYDIASKRIVRYGEQNGLTSNTIYAIRPDLLGNIWMSTNQGLSKLEVKTQRFYNYDASDGLQGGQFNAGSVLYNHQEGYMAFGGTEGLNLFYPAQVKERRSTPQVRITGLQLFNKPVKTVKTDKNGRLLNLAIGETKQIILQPTQTVFTIEFGALDYAYPEKIRYAYKLVGLDRAWNYVGTQRAATYRYLEPGDYTFIVKASTQDQAWGKDFTAIHIRVLPPLWRTPLAYFLYVLASAGLVYLVYVVGSRQKKLRRRLLVAKAKGRKERRQARERLNFFTAISHEFRTPLTLMLGPLEEMLGKENTHSPAGKKLQLVYRNAHKLLSLINKLLDYRKAEAGNMALQVQEVNITAFVEEIHLSFQALAQSKQLAFSLQVPETPVWAWCDREKLEMVLNNLLSNSFKYIGQGSSIAISLRTEPGKGQGGQPDAVVVEVKDNGIGIPAGQLKHIFDWFYQGNPVAPMSSGLGLALAKKLVELHQGNIFVTSTVGQGSTFGFRLPLDKAHFDAEAFLAPDIPLVLSDSIPEAVGAAAPRADGHNHGPRKGLKKILIVEDEEEIRKFLQDYLVDSYQVLEAVNGKEGLAQALTHHPDIIISDVMMPVMDGTDLCRALKADLRTSHIPVVLLTARTAFTHQREGLETGADAYLTKPFSPELLRIKLHNLLQAQEKLKRFYLHLFHLNQPPPADLPQPDRKAPSLDEKFLLRIHEILQENLENPDFNVNELAAALCMSRSLVYKKIKALTGAAPVEYLRSLRMQEAARLLKTGQYKVFEVVGRVGFQDDKYFRQCFASAFGCSPSEYIKGSEIAL